MASSALYVTFSEMGHCYPISRIFINFQVHVYIMGKTLYTVGVDSAGFFDILPLPVDPDVCVHAFILSTEF